MNKIRKLTDSVKKIIAGRQYYKCANSPCNTQYGTNQYKCPLWNRNDTHKGSFDEAGYEIDHIKEWSVTHDDSVNNLQALCLSCHRVKTKRFMNKYIL